MLHLNIVWHQQQQDEEEEEEELSEDAPLDHRQIKEDHIEIYGSEGEGAGGDPGNDGSGGERNPGSDYEISQEMYQDDDMQDDGSQVRSEGGALLNAEGLAKMSKERPNHSCILYFCLTNVNNVMYQRRRMI